MKYLYILLLFCFGGCYLDSPKTDETSKRKYKVRLNNHIGSDWYDCDTIIRINENRIQLKNKEDSNYFLDVTLAKDVTLRIYPQ